ncbi:YfhO family protein [Candidatus Shapirobacteria bacterium]|nr:YfhO family protein [Candidatus Shapirobacteria bacterium]
MAVGGYFYNFSGDESLGGLSSTINLQFNYLCAYALFRIRPLISSKILIVILGISLAFLLTASQILPAFDLAQRVTREETQFGVLSKEPYFFPWENLIMILAPDFFGHPATGNFSSRIFFPDNPSIGIIGFLFVAYSFLRIFRKKEIAFWAFFVIYPTLLMLGTPLGQALRLLPIPALSLVTPIKMIWVVAFSLSVLAGIGMDVVSELIRKDWSWRFFSPMVIVWEIIFLVWIAGFLIPAGEQIRVAQRNLFLPTLFLATGSGFIAISLFLPKFWPFIASLIIGLSGTELVHQGIKYNPFINKGLVFPQTEIFKRICEKGDTWRAMIVHPELLPVNSNIPYRISMIDGYASMYDGRYGRLVRLANATLPIREIGGYPRIVFQTEYNSPIIDLLNVRWVLSLSELKNPKLKLVAREGQTALYENINAGPKVFLARQFYVEKNDLTIAQKMLEIDLSKEVVLEEHPNLMAIAEDKSLSEGKAEIIAYQPGKVIVKTQTSTAGILVLTDTYDSGWKAFVGRKATKVFRADYDLRAVEVPAGEHEVEFVYDPLSFKIGLGISLLTVSSLLIGAFLFRIKNLNLVGGLRQREH